MSLVTLLMESMTADAAPQGESNRTVIALVDDDRNILTTVSIALQGEGFATPTYEIVGQVGPDHAPEFAARVLVGEYSPVEGRGHSKQEAQRAAARAMLVERAVEGFAADDA